MWIGQVTLSELISAGRWTVSYFSKEVDSYASAYPMVRIGDFANERKETFDPSISEGKGETYLGLENIRSLTGELVSLGKTQPTEVRSRSKRYFENDVLVGRLRPELNKVFVATSNVSPGICSNEFIVLSAIAGKATPLFLRYILASEFVTRVTGRLRTGAALPRISPADLLEIMVPLPPIEVQARLTDRLSQLDVKLAQTRRVVEDLPNVIQRALLSTMETGKDHISDLLAT